MGWFFRKSATFGPVRFNFSKSGIGVSSGVRGFRVGLDARGRRYVHAGAHGFYYKKTFGKRSYARRKGAPPGSTHQRRHPQTRAPESAPPQAFGGSSDPLLRSLRDAQNAMHRAPFVALACLLAIPAVVAFSGSSVVYIGAVILSATLLWRVTQRDASRKEVLVEYDLSKQTRSAYGRLCSAMEKLAEGSLWLIDRDGQAAMPKYHGGVDSLFQRRPGTAYFSEALPYFRCNVEVPVLEFGSTAYFFLPDRLVLWTGRRFGTRAYSDISTEGAVVNWVEDGNVPKGARVVGRTYQYVNNDGSPDRRFSHNPQWPICEYAWLSMAVKDGLTTTFMASSPAHLESWISALSALREAETVAAYEDWSGASSMATGASVGIMERLKWTRAASEVPSVIPRYLCGGDSFMYGFFYLLQLLSLIAVALLVAWLVF